MGNSIKILCVFLRFPIRPTCPACLKLPDVTTLILMTKCHEHVTKFLRTSPNILVPLNLLFQLMHYIYTHTLKHYNFYIKYITIAPTCFGFD